VVVPLPPQKIWPPVAASQQPARITYGPTTTQSVTSPSLAAYHYIIFPAQDIAIASIPDRDCLGQSLLAGQFSTATYLILAPNFYSTSSAFGRGLQVSLRHGGLGCASSTVGCTSCNLSCPQRTMHSQQAQIQEASCVVRLQFTSTVLQCQSVGMS
jgi:hypothetical protein